MATETREMTWANVDVDDDREMDLFRRQEEKKADERIRRAVEQLQEKGIMDAQGRRVRKDLPPDMQEDSECDLG
ncbi:MAG TPA: hypothetical protein VKM93_23180 [Terriglobia bacterium]|nr:hypothetical protein [Terriglobia bacterium]